MKYLPVGLFVLISAIAMTQSAYANPEPENIPSAIGDNQAAVLMTEPATINGNWDNSQQTHNSFVVVREQGCKKINPLDLLKNPSAFFEQCQSSTNEERPQNSEPVDYLKVPKLDSGVNLTVTQF
ncbi:hypothetical protein [Calothrix sp. PCC 7507]|uniref:hypothetical protein n=1 Tax=Calothrix sp. PCC 7507 TaxID=99598 RepID=UPI00029ED1BD|nr:hypothetical protein [Calothrix sp. PCC 7507]AFY33699.1 hypothetical protein Cal7507_3294 [Calothrix sp. PCC 7507]